MKTLTSQADFNEIIARIKNLNPDSQGLWGKMSVGLMLNHCIDQVKVTMGLLQAKPQSGAFVQGIIKWIFLRLPIQFPKNLKTFKEIEPDLTQVFQVKDFEKAQNTLIDLLNNFAKSSANTVFQHPIFGSMNKEEMGKLTYTHFDHHLRQFGA